MAEVPSDVPVTAFSERDSPPWLNWPGRRFRQRVCDLAQVLKDWRIDCVYDRTYHMTLITAPACQRAGVPRVSTVVSEPRSDFDLQERRFRWVKWRMLNRAYRTADRVVAVSDGVRNGLLESHSLAPQKVVTIHNPVDRDRIERLSAEPLPPDWNPDERHIVAVGRLGPEKDFSTLIESVRILLQQNDFRDVRLWILGEGLLRDRLAAEINASGLSEHVFLKGFVANPYPAIRHAAVLALSSRHEGLPGAILEAMTLGTPVVSTDCQSGPAELLSGGGSGRSFLWVSPSCWRRDWLRCCEIRKEHASRRWQDRLTFERCVVRPRRWNDCNRWWSRSWPSERDEFRVPWRPSLAALKNLKRNSAGCASHSVERMTDRFLRSVLCPVPGRCTLRRSTS